ncbi:MAG: PAS domain S-box protein [Opitutaceae bacterium]
MSSITDQIRRLFKKIGLGQSAKTNASLEAQRRRYQNIIDGTNAGTWDWNIVTGEVIINERWAGIIGFTREEINPISFKTWEQRVHPEDLQFTRDSLDKHFSGKLEYYDVQFRQLHKDGNWRWVHARGKVVERSDEGQPLQMSGTHIDVTQRKEAKISLAKSQRMLRNILDNIPVRVIWKDHNSKFLGGNLLMAKDLGLNETNDLIGKDDYDFSTEEIAREFQIDDKEIMKTKVPRLNYEESQTFEDGHIQRLRKSKLPLQDDNGEVIGVLTTYEDITASSETAMRLAESQLMLRNILDHVPIRVFWKDRNCKFLGANQLVADDLGLNDVNDLIGMDDFDFSTKEAAQAFQADDREIMDSNVPRLNYVESQVLKDGSQQWLRTSKLPLKDHRGEVIGVLGTYEDITDIRNVQEELIQAKEEAEAANAAKDDFLAVMSHEMRTPLNPIIGYADILLQSCKTEPETTYIETIQSAANRQLRLIDDILDFMRMYRGKVTPSTEPFNIVDLCELVLFDAKVSAHDLELRFENGTHGNPVPPELTIDSDLMMLRRVLENLLGNACKYTRKGSITLSISSDIEDPDLYLIKVEDTGIGIDAKTTEHLFDPFSQADSSYTRNYEGAGLGLAICKKLTEILGGEISAESTPGKGSCFTLAIPFQLEQPTERNQPKGTEHSLPIFSQVFDTLIVEDKIENAQIAQTMIELLGGRCKHAKNGQIALTLCKKKKFDVILMDLSMPTMNGLDATIALRSTSNPNQNTPIIAVTADVSQKAIHDCTKAGMNGYVSKPINSTLLYKAIEDGIAAQNTSK